MLRRADAEDQSFPASREGSAINSLEKVSGRTRPGYGSADATAAFIIQAHEAATMGRTLGDAPLPNDKIARMIVECATGKMLEPAQARPNSAAQMILNADRVRRGEDVT